jgi:energy-converting hydrogenase Eha subunit C
VHQVGFIYKIVFVVYIEGAFVGVMNEQCNYIILDKLIAYLKLVADRSSHSEHGALQI